MEYLSYRDTSPKEIPDRELVELYGDTCAGVEMGMDSYERVEELKNEIIKRLASK